MQSSKKLTIREEKLMKKMMTMLCALMLLLAAAGASAETVQPVPSDLLQPILSGKQFHAALNGWSSFGEGDEARYKIGVTVCEYDRFDAEMIAQLQKGDEIVFGNGNSTVVTALETDENGVTVKGDAFDTYYFTRQEDGRYTVYTDGDYPIWTEIFTVEVPLERDIRFLDGSEPETQDAPAAKEFSDLVRHLEDGTSFAPYNTTVTFDENGKLVEFLYTYAPWN